MNEEKDEEIYIICITAQKARWNPSCIVAGSVIKRCKFCDKEIYISLSGQKLQAEKPTAVLVCMPCVKNIASTPENLKVSVVPGAIKEIVDNLSERDKDKS